ncbi:MAG: DUF1501 domain-containing protein [Myxococcota bacterium]|nr:DUF1501 domain-containing protein [Myxococcota bacterium]
MTTIQFGRRSLVRGALGAGALAALGPLGSLLAQERGPARRIVLCDFNGGWDVLLGADARDPSVSHPGIHQGTELLDPAYRTPIEVRCGAGRALWGAPMRALVPHADVATVFRGVNMNTVSHPTGQSYMNTGLQPSGSSPRGSSIGTVFASGGAMGEDGPILPFVAIGTRSYNDRYPREASALRLSRARELRPILTGAPGGLPGAIEAMLEAAREDAQSCVGPTYRGVHPADEQLLSRERLRRLEAEGFASRFDFDASTTAMQDIRARYGFTSVASNTPGVRAATAMQLLRSGLANAVSVRIQDGLDSHANWGEIHPVRLEEGFTALAALIEDLRSDDPNLERTTVVAFSEFARTPRINGNDGRDHWFAASMLVFGGLVPAVFGATNPDDLGLLRVDETTGRPVSGEGLQLRPEHVMATLVTAAGLDASAYRVEPIRSLIPAA